MQTLCKSRLFLKGTSSACFLLVGTGNDPRHGPAPVCVYKNESMVPDHEANIRRSRSYDPESCLL
eukprot:scaffold4037_cov400-Prasinococcus_capsulatus_cf.AAC.10